MNDHCIDELLVLSDWEWHQCADPQTLNPGPYWGWGNKGYCRFQVEIDARPLAILAESAIRGYRLYELMSLRRPGDVLHYFRIRLIDIDEDIQARLDARLDNSWPRDRDEPTVLSLPVFDGLFYWDADDTAPEAHCWLMFRREPIWRDRMTDFFALVLKCQQELSGQADYLVQGELARIAQKNHWRDFVSDLPRHPEEIGCPSAKTRLSPGLFHLIQDLIGRETVQSVSCPLDDYALWRLLVEQQVRRAEKSGKPPQEAFELSGPDSGLSFANANDWGGEVHIPYEGAGTGSLFIKPGWRKFSFGSMKSTCKFLLTQEDYGEQDCATRTVVDDWVLYEYNGSYTPDKPSA